MLAASRVKEFLNHPNPEVREQALYYLEFHHDRSVASADDLWHAIDSLGMESSRRLIDALPHFRQSDYSMQRLCEYLPTLDVSKLATAAQLLDDIELPWIEKYKTQLTSTALTHEFFNEHIERRIASMRQSSETLWDALVKHSESIDYGWDPVNWRQAMYLVDAVVMHQDDSWTRAAELLRQDRKDTWLEIFAINLLGKSRRPELLEVIRERMNLYDDVQNEQIIAALVRLNDPQVVEYLAPLLLTENHDFKFSAFEVLARYPTAASQQVMLKAAAQPTDEMDLSTICSFLMRHIPTEPEVLSIVCKAALDPTQYSLPIDFLDELLLTQCKMTGIELPEADQLREIGAKRVQSRARSMVQSRAQWEDDYPDEFVMPVTSSEKIGRNDPCPCGSGKKYKKCCLGKEPAK